jgi:hypothetical protein
MTNVAATMMTDEEKAEIEKQINQNTQTQSVAATAHVETNGHSSSSSHIPNSSESPASSSKDKKRNKLTPEQRKKLEELDHERLKVMEERVTTLTGQLIERLRPFVDAKHPGDKDDPETVTFESKMRREADDMKLESFGLEVSDGLCIIILFSI